jgi:membrane-associated phospholipid phosphatase
VGLAALVLALTTLDVAHHGSLTDFDRAVSRRMIDWDLRHNSVVRPMMRVLVMFGQRGVVLAVTVPVICYLTWRARRSEFALRYLLALVTLTIAVYALKNAVPRYAPLAVTKSARQESYPSGHLANAILVWGVVTWCALRAHAPSALSRALRVIRAVAPAAVIVGMTVLDYHWISDFIGGACIGILLLPVVLLPVWGSVAARIDRRVAAMRAGVP